MIVAKKVRGNCYDQTRKLALSIEEQRAGWEIVDCINCQQGRRRVMATCQLCGGRGRIKVLDNEKDSFEKSPPGRPKRKGRAA